MENNIKNIRAGSKSVHKSNLNFYCQLYENAKNGGNTVMFTSSLANRDFLRKL